MYPNRWLTFTPVPDVPSPKVQAYDAAFFDVVASKLQVIPEQVYVKAATGTTGGGGASTTSVRVARLGPPASLTVRGGAGHVRRGHRGAGDRVRRGAARVPGRGDVDARCEDVDARSDVRPARLGVRVVGGTHGDCRGHVGRRVVARVLRSAEDVAVAGGDRVGDAGIDGVRDGLVERGRQPAGAE